MSRPQLEVADIIRSAGRVFIARNRCFAALHSTPPKNESQTSTAPAEHPLWRCPNCGGPMAVVERLTAAQLQLRSPPLRATAA
jgi:hypothetical protein